MFTTVEQVKKIITNFLNNTGRGGFMTGVVSSISPLKIKAGARLEIPEENLYITDNCIGLVINLRHKHNYSEGALNDGVVLREALQVGDGVLLLCRPRTVDGTKYIVLDRIQPYKSVREVDGL
ncbi:hypothetical protein Q428_08665 [Fervidicella metallireducens AeB]|uniref:Phage protein n=1 Tax=Fervidicella metallireducens AeB TaxID=1403537 RepID=A0A017RUA5_9CLOT|nr:DUF2577 domain-containing protein [Fervidicella metallireducens]EYE88262.1 hypothetical protein Q428_08665 [Fervidicella metallireducens AeB]